MPARKKRAYRQWTDAEIRRLRDHAAKRTPVRKLPRLFRGRSEGNLRTTAHNLGIRIGHRRRKARANAR